MNYTIYKKNGSHRIINISVMLAVILLAGICLSASGGSSTAFGKAADSDARYFRKAAPDNRTVSVLNGKMRRWLKNYKVGTTKKYYKKGEASRPAYTVLTWKTGSSFADRYIVSVATKKNMKGAVSRSVSGNKLKLSNLRTGKKYYWQITGRRNGKIVRSRIYSFKTAKTARTLKAAKVSNLRDMGGYKTTEGKRIRQGKIYRSGNMDSISSHGKKTLLNELKIRTDLDLRNYGQGLAGKRSPLGARVRYISIHGIMYEEVWKVSGRKGSGRTVAQNTSTLIKEMKVFANKDNYPIIFHCIYGRDRTGTLAFTLGALLGMKKADLYKDYEMTFFSEVSSKSKINIKKRVERFNKLYNYMKKYSDPKRSLQYNVERYLLDNGMTKKELRTIKKVMLK